MRQDTVNYHHNLSCDIHVFPQTCRYPFAEFLLAGGERLLTPGHTYTVAVELEMPESPRNENLGR